MTTRMSRGLRRLVVKGVLGMVDTQRALEVWVMRSTVMGGPARTLRARVKLKASCRLPAVGAAPR
jgi:hypothetical protein